MKKKAPGDCGIQLSLISYKNKIFISSVNIITTGVVHYYDPNVGRNFIASVPYHQDDHTWCIQRSRMFPMFLNYFMIASPDIWIIGVIFFVYVVGTILFFNIELDGDNSGRRHRDWHYYIISVVLAAILGNVSRLRPNRWHFRIYHFIVLIMPLPIHILIGAFSYNYMKFQFYLPQVSTIQELVQHKYRLGGSQDVLEVIHRDPKVCILFPKFYFINCIGMIAKILFSSTTNCSGNILN